MRPSWCSLLALDVFDFLGPAMAASDSDAWLHVLFISLFCLPGAPVPQVQVFLMFVVFTVVWGLVLLLALNVCPTLTRPCGMRSSWCASPGICVAWLQ